MVWLSISFFHQLLNIGIIIGELLLSWLEYHVLNFLHLVET